MTTSADHVTGTDPAAARAALLRQRLRAARDRSSVIPRLPDGTAPPLSFAQERLWFMDQFAPGSTAYVISSPVRLRGRLEPEALIAALDATIARHQALRMRFPATPDGQPVVVVDDEVRIGWERVDVPTGLPDEARVRAAVDVVTEAASRPFDLATGPLVRAVLVRLADDDHVLTVVVHHIVFDGWSISVLLGDLFAAYDDLVRDAAEDHGSSDEVTVPDDEVAVPPAEGRAVRGRTPSARYGDFAAWQRERYRGERSDEDLAYWLGQLAGVPPLAVPTDRPRPAEQTFRGAACAVSFEASLAQGVLRLSREHGATAYMTLLAAYQTLLWRCSGQDDFAVGSAVAGRTLPELERTVGLFANMLPVRADLAGNPTFAELLDRVRDTVLDAFSHQEAQLDRIVAELRLPRDVSRSPIFQATFSVLNYAHDTSPPAGLRVEPFPSEHRATRFDLELYLLEPRTGIGGYLTYNADLFTPETIEQLAARLGRLLRAVTADPTVRVGDIDLLDPAERELVLHRWNDTTVDIGEPATLAELVEAQVARTPDAVAVVFEDVVLSYRELDTRAEALARVLRRTGVRPESIVAVCAERSPELVTAILAVVKAGGAYLPLDPEYPADRLRFMLEDAAPVALLVHGTAAAAISSAVPPTMPVIRLDQPESRPESRPTDDTATEVTATDEQPAVTGPDNAAYVIYTSGSTGRPKGVVNTHRGIHNRLDWMQRTYRLGADDAVLQKTPAGFDVSVWEFFWPLLAGARLVLARPGGHKDAAYLRDLIQEQHITTVHFVPSMLAVLLAEDGVEYCRTLRRVICSGEALPVHVARAAADRFGCPVHNLYGPTEAAIDVSSWDCRPEALVGLARVPIGRPIQNVRLYVLDPRQRPVPPGLPGEVFIAGTGVARGYLNRPELTAQRFHADRYAPAGSPPGGRMYATGDLARHRPDGALEYLGRLDDQVKLRGQRIELGEIEAVLRDLPGVRDAVAAVREDQPGDQRLVAYLLGRHDLEVAPLRRALRTTLPDYMVPGSFVVLDAFPLTPNGKLDRRALPAPVPGRPEGAATAEPRTELERTIAEVWRAVLGCERIGIDDDFFDLGGHSLLATQVVARLRTALPAGSGRIGVMDLLKNPTVRQLGELAQVPVTAREPRRLLYELTPPVPPGRPRTTLICVPYGGGSAIVYRPLAEALPAGWSLYAVGVPGHDLGLDEDHLAFDDLVETCVAEVLERVEGPVMVYGHCGIGGAVAVGLACGLERAGRAVEAVYIGAVFPFARPEGWVTTWGRRLEHLRGDRIYTNRLKSLGADLSGLEPEQIRTLVLSLRADNVGAERYFTSLTAAGTVRLSAPIVSVVGERDDITAFYQERYREWHFLTDTAVLAVLDEAGHFFLKHRADELATILSRTRKALLEGGEVELPRREDGGTWWVEGVSLADDPPPPDQSSAGPTPAVRALAEAAPDRRPGTRSGPEPGMRRFLAVATGQLVSMLGSAMTEFAVPLWIYLHTGSLIRMAIFSAVGMVPGILVLPLAGALVDRYSRRAVMLISDCAAAAVQGCFLALVLTDRLRIGHIYVLLAGLSLALTFQRLAYNSAVPQLVPKRFLGHANGLVQTAGGVTQFLVPLAAAAMLASIGLSGILVVDVISYLVVIGVVAATRFPRMMGWRRRESVGAEIRTGFRYAMSRPGFRAMILFFAITNLFVGPALMMVQPLVLGFGTLSTVTLVAIVAGAGVTTSGVIMAVWGGPAQHRMRGILLSALGMAAGCLVIGLRPAVPVVAVGVFGLFLSLAMMNAIYATTVQVKVPTRYHGRVFSVHTLFAWCTLPIGFVVVGPSLSGLFQPLLRPGGDLAPTVGQVIGTGPGRGIALTYLLFAGLLALSVAIALWHPLLRHFDRDVPDAESDDLVGLSELRRHRDDPAAVDSGREPHVSHGMPS